MSQRTAGSQETARSEETKSAETKLALGTWAKLSPEHGLLAHLQDARAMSEVLLARGLGHAATLSDVSPRVLSALVGLHDLGKCTGEFQTFPGRLEQHPDVQQRLKAAGLTAPNIFRPAQSFHHAGDTASYLKLFLELPPRKADKQPHLLGLSAHHGPPLHPKDAPDQPQWRRGAKALLNTFLESEDLSGVPAPSAPIGAETLQEALKVQPRAPGVSYALTAGLSVMCDSLASAFPAKMPWPQSSQEAKTRATIASAHAKDVLRQAQWEGQVKLGDTPWPDRALHSALRNLVRDIITADQKRQVDAKNNPESNPESAPENDVPLIIIHAPTGEGKTAAALICAKELQAHFGLRGMHVTLPNRAASTGTWQALSRLIRAGQHAGQGDQAVPELDESPLKLPVLAQGGAGEGWFSSRGRALLAPLAVGTIDQVLLAAVGNHRWNHLRLLGLSKKLIVIDEVHASDAHAMRLLRALLPWLRAMKSPVILMSATLDQPTERSLTHAWLGKTVENAPLTDRANTKENTEENTEEEKPTIELNAWFSEQTFHARAKSAVTPRRVEVEHISANPALAATQVRSMILGGARQSSAKQSRSTSSPSNRNSEPQRSEHENAGMIFSSVDRAQEAALTLLPELGVAGERGLGVLCLHSRMTQRMRRSRAALLTRRCGPESTSERAGLIISATSVLGISLDIDLDLLMTDPCPADELLQRLGRLWRHHRPEREQTRSPRLLLSGAAWGSFEREASGWKEASWLYGHAKLAQFELGLMRELREFGALELPRRARELIEHAALPLREHLSPEREIPAWLLEEERAQAQKEELSIRLAETGALTPPDQLPLAFARHTPWHGDKSNDEHVIDATRQMGQITREILPMIMTPQGWRIYATDSGEALEISEKNARDNSIPVTKKALIHGGAILEHDQLGLGDPVLISMLKHHLTVEIQGHTPAISGVAGVSNQLIFDPVIGLYTK